MLSSEEIKEWKEKVKGKWTALEDANEEIKNNPDIILEAIINSRWGEGLYFAGEQVKNNPKVVMEAVKRNGRQLKYASDVMKNNPEIVMEAVKNSASSLKYASEDLRDNPDIVITALNTPDYYGKILQYAGENARNNPKVVLEAVKHDLNNFQYAGEDTRNNEVIILEAFEKYKKVLPGMNCINPIEFIGEDARNNPIIIREYINNTNFTGYNRNGSKYMKKVKEIMGFDATGYEVIMKEIIKKDAMYFRYEGEKVNNNPEIVIEAIKKDASLIQYAGEEVKNNPEISEILIKAIKKDATLIQYVGEDIKNNSEIVKDTVNKNPRLLQYAGHNFIRDNSDYVINIIRENDLTNTYNSEEKFKSIFNEAKREVIDREDIDKNDLNSKRDNDKENNYDIETISAHSDYILFQDYYGYNGIYYRASGNTKLFESFNNGQYIQLLPTIKKGEFIPVDDKNIHLEFSSGRYIIPLEVCDDTFKRCICDEDYKKALIDLGYDIPDDACDFKESIIEPHGGGYGTIYSEGLSQDTNEELLQNFIYNYGDSIELDDLVNIHINDLLKCMGGKHNLLRFIEKNNHIMNIDIENLSERINEIKKFQEMKRYEPSEIGSDIEPRSEEIEQIINETKEIAKQSEKNKKANIQEGQTQSDE